MIAGSNNTLKSFTSIENTVTNHRKYSISSFQLILQLQKKAYRVDPGVEVLETSNNLTQCFFRKKNLVYLAIVLIEIVITATTCRP